MPAQSLISEQKRYIGSDIRAFWVGLTGGAIFSNLAAWSFFPSNSARPQCCRGYWHRRHSDTVVCTAGTSGHARFSERPGTALDILVGPPSTPDLPGLRRCRAVDGKRQTGSCQRLRSVAGYHIGQLDSFFRSGFSGSHSSRPRFGKARGRSGLSGTARSRVHSP